MKDGGQALVEFALGLPVFLLLCFGVLQVALVAQAWFFCHYATHCAARTYAVSIEQGEEYAFDKARISANQAIRYCRPRPSLDLHVTWPGQDTSTNSLENFDKQVFDMEGKALYPLLFLKSRIRLRARVTMQAEDVPDFLRQHP